MKLEGSQEIPMAPEIVERRPRRTFTSEFKAQTARLVFERGGRIRVVARELDLNASLVSRWVRKAETSAA